MMGCLVGLRDVMRAFKLAFIGETIATRQVSCRGGASSIAVALRRQSGELRVRLKMSGQGDTAFFELRASEFLEFAIAAEEIRSELNERSAENK